MAVSTQKQRLTARARRLLTRRQVRLIAPVLVSLVIFSFVVGGYYLLLERPATPASALPARDEIAALRLAIVEDGLYAVPVEAIVASGLVDDVTYDSVALSRDSRDIPYLLDGEGDAQRLLFFATGPEEAAASAIVYLLSPGAGRPMHHYRSEARDDAPEAAVQLLHHWEENSAFLPQADGADSWFGPFLFGPTTFELPLEPLTPTGGEGTLTLRFWSNNQSPVEPDHHVVVSLNGRQLGEHFWDGIREETMTLTIPGGLLKDAANALTIEVPNDTGAVGDAVYLDWVSIQYAGHVDGTAGDVTFLSRGGRLLPRGFEGMPVLLDITEPLSPRRLLPAAASEGALFYLSEGAERHYLAAASGALAPVISAAPRWAEPLRDTSRHADYIAILPDDPAFAAALEPLLNFRAETGLAVTAVTLAQIYDEFGHGRATPEAIRDFLAYAYNGWAGPAPRFVLFAGDASYDPHGLTPAASNRDILPTALQFTQYAGNVASDTWFTIFEDGSLVPQMAIGRLPAQTPDQLATMVAKTLAYEQAPGGDARNAALLVADDEVAFDRASDRLAQDLAGNGYATHKLYMTAGEDIRDDILERFNDGVGIVNYVGHGGVKVWADEVVFQAEDAASLQNGDRLPIFTTFTCLNGYFNHPEVDALAETLLWAEDGGIVAAVAPSGRSLTTQQEPIADAFYAHLLDDAAPTLGEALMVAKIASAGDMNQGDVIFTFNLLGDPALRFQRPSDA